jgi:hypothetical protein
MKKLTQKLMTTLFALGLPVAMLGTANAAPNQPPAAPPQQQSPATDVSDAEIKTFAKIYVDIQEVRQGFGEQMANAEGREEAQAIQAELQEKTITVIEDHGWSLDKYNTVAAAITADPETKQEAIEMIREISES